MNQDQGVLVGPRTNQHVYGERELTVIVRQGDRSTQEKAPKQWLPLDTPVPVYFIKVPGDPATGKNPVFAPDDGTTVKIVERFVKRLGDVTDKDLYFGRGRAVPYFGQDPQISEGIEGMCDIDALDAAGWPMSVRGYLETELSPGKRTTPDDILTIYHVEYLPNETPAAD